MSKAIGIEKMRLDDLQMYPSESVYALVTDEDVIGLCFEKKDAEKIMYALNRKEKTSKG